MKKLIRGILDFRKNSLSEYRNKLSKLASRQSPDTLFVACCDSRVVPNTFASSDPGDLFVLRNIGNLVPPCNCKSQKHTESDVSVAATIEFSLLNLNTKDIIVCGHSECGAMEALIKDDSESAIQPPHLKQWLEHAAPSYERFKKEYPGENPHSSNNLLSKVNVLQQLDHLKTYPLVKERLQNKTLRIHGWWFDLATADIYHYDQKSKEFILIDEAGVKNILISLT
jgi:carbonic anhydrase